MENSHEVKVKIEISGDARISRVFAILKDRIQQRVLSQVIESENQADVILAVGVDLPSEAFRIESVGSAVRIAGGSARGLLYGVGKFLRTSCYGESFQTSSWRGTSAPQGSLRGMYFASHFHNWYHEAPEAEVTRYVEDIALWGVNSICLCFPFIDLQDWENPQAETAVAMVRKYARISKELGLWFGMIVSNTLFANAPRQLRAVPLPDPTRRRGNSGHPICPSIPDGHVYILENLSRLFERLSDIGLDFLIHWPYDEGGCACESCSPWGSNGYLKLSHDLTRLGQRYFPNLKTVLSTWMFDTPPEGEWQGLTEELRADGGWVDGVLADAHEDFPRYPLDVCVPGSLPLLNFPEISMWGNWPWGGAGANPLPARFQHLWDQVKHLAQGGFPYSEGIYEDLNKAVVGQFYWDRDRSARETLEEYIAYEFGPGVIREVLDLIQMFEAVAACSYQRQPVNLEEVRRAYRLAEEVDKRLPAWARQSWRWELLHLRAVLDHERFAGSGLETPAAEDAMLRLMEIYHCQMETDDPYHHRVRPPLRRAVSRLGEL